MESVPGAVATEAFVFAPEERDVYSHSPRPKVPRSLGAKSASPKLLVRVRGFAPTERGQRGDGLVYKHLAPNGAKSNNDLLQFEI
jgi:hypothetical protein